MHEQRRKRVHVCVRARAWSCPNCPTCQPVTNHNTPTLRVVARLGLEWPPVFSGALRFVPSVLSYHSELGRNFWQLLWPYVYNGVVSVMKKHNQQNMSDDYLSCARSLTSLFSRNWFISRLSSLTLSSFDLYWVIFFWATLSCFWSCNFSCLSAFFAATACW